MSKDLIEIPRFNFFIGDEVLLKGKIVGFDVDENKCVENVVRLEYGQTLNVPNNNIYITDDIVDKSKIKVTIPQFVADWIERSKREKRNLRNVLNNGGEKMRLWFLDQENYDLFGRAWLDGYEVEQEKRYRVRLKGLDKDLEYLNFKHGHVWVFSDNIENEEYRACHTRTELEKAGFGEVFNSSLFDIEEVE
ncbi:DUF1642 domain-containing protein [Streptococcus oralis subsp. tigurinus]|uniref:DUF1642 domain-containing protein n=1 Tax=Streptococcus oralis TaxID=1303 RepID=UPI0039C46B35